MEEISHPETVPLREIWPNEAAGFTPWLAAPENLKLLSDKLGIALETTGQEQRVGPYRADIVCKESKTGKLAVIENQLEETDHSHLGQLLTYAAAHESDIVIWIATSFTDEHLAALDWLNEKSQGTAQFFGVQVKACRIDQSAPAPFFDVVSKPNDWSNRVRQLARQATLTSAEQLQFNYWTALQVHLASTRSRIRINNPPARYFVRANSTPQGYRCGFEIYISENQIGAYVGAKDAERVAALRRLEKREKAQVERELGQTPYWYGEKKNEFWIGAYVDADPNLRADWPRQHQWLAATLAKLLDVTIPRLTATAKP